MTRPRFITLEGGEGAGKSTQCRLLTDRLQALGHKVVQTREPGGAPGAENIRKLLVTGEAGRWTPKAEALLHFAAREDHLAHTIRPALERGEWVVCDRFIDSTRAYQGMAQGLDPAFIETLVSMVVGADMPTLTLILDMPVAAGLARAGARQAASGAASTEDRYERMGTAFHENLRKGFLDIAAREPERCAVIKADREVDQVAADIRAAVSARFSIEL